MPQSLSRQTLIIIIVCASIGSLLFFLILWRCLRSRCGRNSAPLPPIQPLAHHREHQLARLEAGRPVTWYDPVSLPPVNAPFGSSARTSKTSLLLPDSPNPPPSGHGSFQFGTPEEELAALNLPDAQSPMAPNHSTPNPSTPNYSTPSPSTSVDEVGVIPRPISRNPTRRPRPVSVASLPSSARPRSVRDTIRGAPHAPHNQIQIILPAPLSPESNSYLNTMDSSPLPSRPVSRYDDGLDRLSVADKWLTSVSRSSSPGDLSRPSDSDDARRSFSSMSSNSHLGSGSRAMRRASANPRLSHSQSVPVTSLRPVLSSELPPVPSIPSGYHVYDAAPAINSVDNVNQNLQNFSTPGPTTAPHNGNISSDTHTA